MRGKHAWRHDGGSGEGLIPAHAGKTEDALISSMGLPAHPRACGENGIASPSRLMRQWLIPAHAGKTSAGRAARSTAPGSSPRMRGKQCLPLPRPSVTGLIPAHAGKTLDYIAQAYKTEAHPRACGENTFRLLWWVEQRGSSPRMRGKPRNCGDGRLYQGLIPAHAGKTKNQALE